MNQTTLSPSLSKRNGGHILRAKLPCLILTFYTTADAIAFEEYAKEKKLSGRLIPIPRELSAGCGMAFRIEKSLLPPDYNRLITDSRISIQEFSEMDY